jgi:hypothetical protein
MAGGHDFAVVGQFIVDWWGWEYDQALESPVLSRCDVIRSGKYKSQDEWMAFEMHDFRSLSTKRALRVVDVSRQTVSSIQRGGQNHD